MLGWGGGRDIIFVSVPTGFRRRNNAECVPQNTFKALRSEIRGFVAETSSSCRSRWTRPPSTPSSRCLSALTDVCCGYRGGLVFKARITQLKAQGPSQTCNESKEGEEEVRRRLFRLSVSSFLFFVRPLLFFFFLFFFFM